MSQKEDEYEKLKLRVLKIGIAIPGTIRETFLICGKENWYRFMYTELE